MSRKTYLTSPTLVIVPSPSLSEGNGSFAVFDYLKGTFATLPCEALFWLSYFKQPHTVRQAYEINSSSQHETVYAEIDDLINRGLLIPQSEYDSPPYCDFRERWKWDLTTALFHFTVTDNEFVSEADAAEIVAEKTRSTPQPDLFWLNRGPAIQLPPTPATTNEPLMATMLARRTNRTSCAHALTADQLGKCLFAGTGITGEVETPSGWLPLGMTPSGGARNPFEAFAIVRRNADIPPGVYHYSAAEHSLGLVNTDIPDSLAACFANQTWVDEMGTIIVLTAIFERTMWKYEDPNAYRVILIEAGHIAQNIMLAATDLGFSACPTAALAHSKLRTLFGLSQITHAPLYALTIDKPMTNLDNVRPWRNSPALSNAR